MPTPFPLFVFILGMLFACFFLHTPHPAFAQANYYNADQDDTDTAVTPGEEEAPQPTTLTVTSIEKCYKQIGREDALDIQRNFVKPYQECQRRLALKLKKATEKPVPETKKDAKPEPEIPQGFYRVPAKEKGESSEHNN